MDNGKKYVAKVGNAWRPGMNEFECAYIITDGKLYVTRVDGIPEISIGIDGLSEITVRSHSDVIVAQVSARPGALFEEGIMLKRTPVYRPVKMAARPRLRKKWLKRYGIIRTVEILYSEHGSVTFCPASKMSALSLPELEMKLEAPSSLDQRNVITWDQFKAEMAEREEGGLDYVPIL